MKRIFFFATPADVKPVLRRFEANAPLKFVEMNMLATPNRAIYLDSSDIPNPGIAAQALLDEYMVSHRDTKNLVVVVDTDLGRRWLLTNADNEETVILTLAGLWKTGTLLPGLMDTMHDTKVAQQLMRWFISALKQEGFVKIEYYWLGKEALAMLKAGRRLTDAEQAPPECDLQLPEHLWDK